MSLNFGGTDIGGISGGQTIRNQDKTITTNGEYTADTGYTGLGTVTVEVEGGITPTGTINITTNGSKDVTNYATANVNVQPTLKDNIAVVGSLTKNNGVISGFSSSNYIKLPFMFNPSTFNWEQCFKFTTGSDVITNQRITASSADMKSGANLLIWNKCISPWFTSNGTSWDIATQSNATNQFISANSTYYVKAKCVKSTNYTYTIEYSTNGTDYTVGTTFTSANKVSSSQDLQIGCGADLPVLGSIDLNGCYIKVNGVYIWQGRVIA